jgi:hypothetical protein
MESFHPGNAGICWWCYEESKLRRFARVATKTTGRPGAKRQGPDRPGPLPAPPSAATVLRLLAGGLTEREIVAEYPDLQTEDIRECLRFAASSLMERELPLPRSV